MRRILEMPVHTDETVLLLAKKDLSFNQIQYDLRLSPSTLSRILKFLQGSGIVDFRVVNHETRTSKKFYRLTVKGRKAVPAFNKFRKAWLEILNMAQK